MPNNKLVSPFLFAVPRGALLQKLKEIKREAVTHPNDTRCLPSVEIRHQITRHDTLQSILRPFYVATGGDAASINAPCWHVHCLLLIPEESYLLSLLSLVEITEGVSQVENCFLIDI